MSHQHSAAGAHRGRLLIVLAISSTIFIAEIVVGLLSNSLALLADAGHVFADIVATALALGAIQLASRPATGKRTFGFYRFEILAAVLNAVLLFAIAGYVLIEAWRRFGTEPADRRSSAATTLASSPTTATASIGPAAISGSLPRRRHASMST